MTVQIIGKWCVNNVPGTYEDFPFVQREMLSTYDFHVVILLRLLTINLRTFVTFRFNVDNESRLVRRKGCLLRQGKICIYFFVFVKFYVYYSS